MKMVRRLLGPIVIVVTLSLAGVIASFFNPAGAQSTAQPNMPAPPPAGSAPPHYTSSSLGTQSAGDINADQAKGVGPVDQSAPLDFKTQPKSVPHVYVPGQLYNVQVLKGYTYGTLVGQMTDFQSGLGVGCEYCHNLQNFAYDTPTKILSREMIVMSQNVQQNWVGPIKHDFPNYAVNGNVGCVTCHRGQARIAVQYNIVPVEYLDYRYKSTKQVGYAVNSMYSVAKSLGVNCLFCHNTADFISLQYYPTNQIAHRMWRMVDAINHQYLPASVKAVTCYTCHQGAKWPQALVATGTDETPVEATALHPEVHENPGAHLATGAQL